MGDFTPNSDKCRHMGIVVRAYKLLIVVKVIKSGSKEKIGHCISSLSHTLILEEDMNS